jgi:HSP20 family protein
MLERAFFPMSIWREMSRLQREMNQLLTSWPRLQFGLGMGYPAMNIWSNDEGAIVTAELPGVDAASLDISVKDNVLTISGSREPLELGEGSVYHRRERGYGRFTRTFQLPFQVAADKVEASLEKGVLKIALPRAEADKPKKIAVQAG